MNVPDYRYKDRVEDGKNKKQTRIGAGLVASSVALRDYLAEKEDSKTRLYGHVKMLQEDDPGSVRRDIYPVDTEYVRAIPVSPYLNDDDAYRWQPDYYATPYPNVQSFFTDWDWFDRSNIVRQLFGSVVVLTQQGEGLDEVAVEHDLIVEALTDMFSDTDYELPKLRAATGFGDLELVSVLGQNAMADLLGYMTSEGLVKPEGTNVRLSRLEITALKQELR